MDTGVSKKRSRLLKKSGVVGGLTLVSRVLGFIRDAVIAWLLGSALEVTHFSLHSGCRIFCGNFFGRDADPLVCSGLYRLSD